MVTLNPFILLILIPGGWDTTMVFDSKLDSSYVTPEAGAQHAYGASKISYVDHPDRKSVRKWFESYGNNAAIINGLYTGSISRQRAIVKSLSTIPPEKHKPVDWLTFYAASLNPTLLAPHFVIDSPYFPGHLGSTVISMTSKKIKNLAERLPTADSAASAKIASSIERFRRNELAKFSANVAEGTLDGDKYASIYSSAIRNFALEKAVQQIGNSLNVDPSESSFLTAGKFALDMFSGGYSICATISHKDPSYWETYENHFQSQSALFESLFSDLLKIMDHGSKKGILPATLIILMSERGRSPKLNKNLGKGSWPYSSMLLWGPGIKGGTVSGKTDPFLRGIPIDPIFGAAGVPDAIILEPANVFAGLFTKFNIPTKLLVPNIKPLSTIIEIKDLM